MRGERPFYLATDYDQGFRPLGLASLNLTSSLSDCRRHAPELRVGRLVNVVPPAAVGAHSCCGSEREHDVYVGFGDRLGMLGVRGCLRLRPGAGDCRRCRHGCRQR